MRRLLMILAVALSSGGCVSVHEMTARLPREMAGPEEARTLTHRWTGAYLKDPASARYRGWSSVVPGYVRGPFLTVGEVGWTWTVQINAKNSYGGYVGFRPYRFIHERGDVVRGWSSDKWGQFPWPPPVYEFGREDGNLR